jgi:protein O-mannosyl-transferase
MHKNTCILGILIIAVVAIILAVYWPVLSCQAESFDDLAYCLGNPLVQSPSWASAKRFLCEVLKPSTVHGYYQPLTMISLMVDYALLGPVELGPYHITNLTLHITNTVLIIILLYILFGNPYTAAIVGLLFGLHPLTVEPVAWVSERKTLLAAFFSLLCMVFYILFARRHKFGFYITCFLMYVLSLMSKPTGTMLPVCLLLLDYWPLNRLSKKTVLEKIPFFAITVISSIITFISQKLTCGLKTPNQYGFFRIPLVVCYDIIFYLKKIVWPVDLCPFYPFPERLSLSNPSILLSVIGCAFLIFFLIISLKCTRALIFAGIFFFIALFPTMQIFQVSDVIASDKYVYLPSVGILIAFSFFLYNLWLKAAAINKTLYLQFAAAIIIGFLCIAESLSTRSFLVNWRDTITHWRNMLNNTPGEEKLRFNLAYCLEQKGDFNEAILHYNQVINKNKPGYYQYNSFINIASCFEKTGRYADLKTCYTNALINYHDSHVILNSLAWMLATFPEKEYRDGPNAVLYAKKACELTEFKTPEYIDTLAAAYAEAAQFDEAVKAAEQAIETALSEKKPPELAEDIKTRLNLYKDKLPYREKLSVMQK